MTPVLSADPPRTARLRPIGLLVETRDETHAEQVVQMLRSSGFDPVRRA